MNDSRDCRSQLLADTLQGDWASGPAAAMAQRAAAAVRRRRALKHTALAVSAAAVMVAAIFVNRRAVPVSVPAPAPVAQHGYEIISDDELVATLRDRPLLVLPQDDGSKKIVVLEQ